MREITRKMVRAFESNTNWKLSNTEVVVYPDATRVYLHDNMIAKSEDGETTLYNGGWCSNTTKERLNALMPHGFAIVQRNFEWYFSNPTGELVPFENGLTTRQIEELFNNEI